MANEIIILISASGDSFGACSENCPGIWAAGDTVEVCKADTVQAIELIKKNMPREDWPEPLKAGEYTITWRYDTESFLYYFGSFISLAGMERIIHQNPRNSGIEHSMRPGLWHVHQSAFLKMHIRFKSSGYLAVS